MGKKNYISHTENKPCIDNQYTNKMLKKHTYFFIFLLLLVGITGFSQTFPVSISTQINQPSPIYWSNYADATTSNSPIKMQIVLNDLTIANRQVRIKCYWQGNGISFMNNDFVVGAQPLFLEGGVPLQLTNVNLAPYFEFQNIVGITPNQYAQAMPEGIYTFSVEVYDVATGQKLSRKSTVTAVIFQNEPPLLNLPLNQVSIMQQNIQNIVFSWTPRQINVSNVEYQFDLIEIWDQYTPVQNAFAYFKPIYTTTTRATTLQYGVAEPQLIPGIRYAWRIKAKALVGAEEIGVFKNNGYSEIFAFSYEVYCTPPLQISTEGVSQDQAKITWSGALDNFDYQVNYREKNADSQWYPLETPREYATLANLKPNTAYEYTVGASCEKGTYVQSSIQEFTTLAQDEIAFTGCGIKPDPKDLANQNPLQNLLPNDVVTAGDFPIVVIKATGSNGRFTGEGYVTLPFLEKFRALIDAADALGGEKVNIGQFSRIRITFDNIGVNTDFKLISGEIIASYDPDWKGMGDLDGVVKDVFGDAGEVVNYDIQFVIASVVKNPDGTITVTGTNGASFVQESTPNDIIFTDKNGKQYTVAANAPAGPVESSGQVAPGGIPTPKNTNGMGSGGVVAEISSTDVSVIFTKGDGKYAFDTAPSSENGQLNKTYTSLPQKSGGTYNVPFKAISNIPYEKDVIVATADFKNGKTKKDLVFKTQNGTAIDSTQITWNGNVATLTLKKTLDFAKETVIATVRPKEAAVNTIPLSGAGGSKYDIAGTFDLWHLTHKKINVTLVSVNGAAIPIDAARTINQIYEPIGISFNVNTKPITLNHFWDNTIETGDSDLLNTYTAEQQAITLALKTKLGAEYTADTYYMLYTNEKASNNYAGFMPLKRQFGFVFDGTNKTLAHELGHGVFGLQHPFKKKEDEGKTDLLMDYGAGQVLNHNDWEIMHAPGLQLYKFTQGSSAGGLADGYGLTPDFKFVSAGESNIVSTKAGLVAEGHLSGFLDSNKIKYIWNNDQKAYTINGESTGTKYNLPTENTVDSEATVWLIYNYSEDCTQVKYIHTKYKEIASIITLSDKVKAQQNLENYIQLINPIPKNTKTKNIVYSGLLGCGNNNINNNSTFYNVYKDSKSIDLNELKIVSNLISKFGDEFYTTYFKPTENQPITNENLSILKISLTKQIELEESLFGKASFENFKKIIAFLEKCKNDYALQTEGYIPRCLWDNNLNIPYIQDPALTAGVADGLIETVVGVYDITKFASCFDFLNYRAWTNDCFETRTKTYSVIKIAYATFTNYDKFSNATAGLWTGIKEYTIETASTSNQARYNQGKIIFNVASLFIGVGEANAILKGEKTLVTVLKESVAAYKQLPKSLAKLITKTGSKLKTKVIKGVSGLSLIYQLNTAEIKLGSIINQGGKAVVKIEVPMTKGTVLETIEECLYLNADNVVSKGTIEVVEDGGKVGLGVKGAGNFLEEVVSTIPASTRNQFHINAERLAPYDEAIDVALVKLNASEEYVRVFKKSVDANGNIISNKESYWFMRKKDVIKSDGSFLTPAEIKNKFALPEAPTHYTKIQTPANTQVYRGVAKEQVQQGWGNGGGTQFEFNQQPQISWFVGEFRLK